MICFEIGRMDIKTAVVQKCIDFLRGDEFPKAGESVEIGNGIRCIVNKYETLQEADAYWEAHRKYVDVHYILSGKEKIGVAYIDECKTGKYYAEQDYLEIDSVEAEKVAVWVMLKPGTVLCLFPNDAHQVKVQADLGKALEVNKVVFKIPVELFETNIE